MAFDAADGAYNAAWVQGYLAGVDRVVTSAENELAWGDTPRERRQALRRLIVLREHACLMLDEWEWEADDEPSIDALKARLRALKATDI